MFTRILTSVHKMLNLCIWIGNICNGLLLGNASIAIGLTCYVDFAYLDTTTYVEVIFHS